MLTTVAQHESLYGQQSEQLGAPLSATFKQEDELGRTTGIT